MKGISAVLVLAIVAVAMFGASAVAQIPSTMNYQVMLTNDSDEPLADQAVTLVFRIYNADVGGSMYWNETHNTTTNSIGVVSVTLGSITPLTLAHFPVPTWMEVEVDSEILTPRRELTSSPYAIHADNADRLGENPASYYALGEDLFVPGVINTPSNPVDWTMLKNVPAGFADGSDASSGAGDGHSLDADDGSPVDALYVDATGNVGIGLTAPAHKFSVYHGNNGFTYGQFANSVTGTAFGDGLIIGVNASGTAYINQGESNPMVFMTSLTERHSIEADGTFKFGSPFSSGAAQFYRPGVVTSLLDIYGGDYGGNIDLFDEAGSIHSFIEADVSGAGGFLRIYGGSAGTYSALAVDGSYLSGDPRVVIEGGSSGTTFNTFNTGDSSVELPFSSVSSLERNNEAGVMYVSGTSTLELDGSLQTLLARSIYCPTSGYVLAIGTVEAEADHENGTISGCTFGVSSSNTSFPTGAELYRRLQPGIPTGLHYEIVTSQWIFQVTTGARTFYLLADETVGDWTVRNRNLSLVFFPSYYGVLAEPDLMVPPRGTDMPTSAPAVPITEADIAAERAECEAAYNASIEAELAAMEARLAEMRESLKNANQP